MRKLSDAMPSTMIWGAQPENKSSTSGKPDSRKPKHTTAVMTKAITWLRVNADRQEPIARNPPAIRKLPMYAATIAPLSGSPR